MPAIKELLAYSDPLTRDVALFLVAYQEEDDRVDYKQNFDPHSEKAWLELTKDVSAFANTWGGYLVFGVTDVERRVEGLSPTVTEVLKNTNHLQQKINRYLDPHLISLRSKAFRIEGKRVVVVLVPQSRGVTHLIGKDGSFLHQSGKDKVVLRAGTFYVRRSGSNHLADSRDLTDVIERRVDQFRSSLMDKVTRVIKSPESSELFLLSRDPSDQDGERFIIDDTPESISIKGMSFTVAPEGLEEEVAAWSVLSRGTAECRPPASVVWRWYAERAHIKLREGHRLAVFRFSLWDHAPPFFWIRRLKAPVICDALLEAIRHRPLSTDPTPMLTVSSFLGKGFYSRALAALGSYRERISPRMRQYPREGPRSAYGTIQPSSRKQSSGKLKEAQLKKLDDIATDAAKAGKEPSLQKRWDAHKMDCFLYAQDDQYK